MQLYNHFPLFIIFLPMIASLVTAMINNAKLAQNITLLVQIILAVLSFWLLFALLGSAEGTFRYKMGYFPAPWGNELRAGPFEALLACAFATVMFFSIFGGIGDSDKDMIGDKLRYFYIMINLLTCSLMVFVFTNDIFTGYVFIEINTLSACIIVVLKENGETVKATIKYLFLSILGSGLFLLATAILYGITGHLLMEPAQKVIAGLAISGEYHLPLIMTLVLYSIAVAVKSALFPFHTWLPDAHGSATTAASAVLSGLVLKGYIVMLLKLVTRVYGIDVVNILGVMPAFFVLGLFSMIGGSIAALQQKDLKRMIAYSSVAHIGYIFMGIGFNTTAGFAAVSFHVVAHAFTKSMLFIAAGALITQSGTKYILEMRGAAKRDKIAGLAFLVGGMSLIGIPLFAGFPSKFYLANAAISQGGNGAWIAVVVLALSTFLNGLYYIPALQKLYSGGKQEPGSGAVAVQTGGVMKLSTSVTLVCMIIANIALGIFYVPLLNALERGFSLLG